MTERLRVTVYDGKYTVIQEESGGMRFLRHGVPWPAADRDLAHTNLVLALAQEVNMLRAENKHLSESLTRVQASFDTTLRSAGRTFTGRRIVNLDCQNERSQ